MVTTYLLQSSKEQPLDRSADKMSLSKAKASVLF